MTTAQRAVVRLLAVLGFTTGLMGASSPATMTADQGPAPPPHGLYLFVSSSIPEATLVALATDAAPLRTPVILRGLVGDSLQNMMATMAPLLKVGAGLEIDPLLFEAYGIEHVPAVVLTCGARGEGPYAVVYGIGPSAALPVLQKLLTCS